MSNERPVRLLLVDDEEEFLSATGTALRRRGLLIEEASCGDDALALLSEHDFDVAVLDVKMPGIDGVDLFRALKDLRPALPVILLTGHGSVQQAFETSKEGVFAYLTKPCEIDQIVEVVGEVTRRAASFDDDPGEVRLLIVDDEPELLSSLAAALERRGLRVEQALSAAEALERVQERRFDVALVDVRMPVMNGVELIRRLRRLAPETEILVLTGHPSMSTAIETFKEGVIDCLAKPQSPDLIARRAREAARVGRRRARERQKRRADKILEQRSE